MALLAALVLASAGNASPLAALSHYALPPANSTLPGMSPAGCVVSCRGAAPAYTCCSAV